MKTCLGHLLGYKLNLPQQKFKFQPYGVITRISPDAPGNIYTQYVFHTELQFSREPRSDDLAELSVDGTLLAVCAQDEDPEIVCCNEKKKPLNMDILAWKAFFSNEPQEKYGSAIFSRGFTLI